MKFSKYILISIFSIIYAQDDFFEPRYDIGGYGELHWNKAADKDGNSTKNNMDFHRFIIYYGYNWTENWSFKSEVELEHNYVKDGDGELELEQAYINYHSDKIGFQGGVILLSVGLLNEYHEPPLFLSVERPLYNKYVIPTTWFGNGFAFYGKFSDFNWRIALMEDLNGSEIGDGIRSARGKGFKTTGYDLLKNFSISYAGLLGLKVGASITMNDAPVTIGDDGNVSSSIGVTLTEFNAKYNANNIYIVFEFGTISYDNTNYLTSEDDPATTEIDETDEFNYGNTSGYYFDLGYNIGDMVGCNKLIPWFRMSNVSQDVDNYSKITDLTRFGLTWWPIDQVAFKMDFGSIQIKSESNPTTEFNVGIGYNF